MVIRKRVEHIPKYDSVRTSENGYRFYQTPLGFMPSVTTVLRDDKKFEGWRKYVGKEKADSVLQQASARGTWTHDCSEQFLLTGKLPEFHYIYQPWWNSMKPFLDNIDHTLLTEGCLWNADNYAGACDCIGYLKPGEMFPDADPNEPVLIDFKTANKPISGTKLYDYELQCAAYVKAANFVYRREGLIIKRALIACAVPDYSVQLLHIDRDDINQLYAHFLERLEDWHEKHVVPDLVAIKPDSDMADLS